MALVCMPRGSCKLWLLLISMSSIIFQDVRAGGKEFQVGGHGGWALPKKDDPMFNAWASGSRFKVDDTLRFKYEKDSVMEVTEEEYKTCRSVHPRFFSNNGDTVFKLERSGFHYFISGVSGHCQRGQKMIVKVLETETPPPSPPPPPSSSNSTIKNGGGGAAIQTPSIIIFLSLSSFCLLL